MAGVTHTPTRRVEDSSEPEGRALPPLLLPMEKLSRGEGRGDGAALLCCSIDNPAAPAVATEAAAAVGDGPGSGASADGGGRGAPPMDMDPRSIGDPEGGEGAREDVPLLAREWPRDPASDVDAGVSGGRP